MPSSPLKTQLLSPSRPPGTLAGELCRFPPGASTNQTQAASRSQDAWGLRSQGWPPASPRGIHGNFLPSVCVTQTLLCILQTTHPRTKGAQSVGLRADAHPGSSARARHRFLWTLGRSCLIAKSAHSEGIKSERQAVSRLWPRRTSRWTGDASTWVHRCSTWGGGAAHRRAGEPRGAPEGWPAAPTARASGWEGQHGRARLLLHRLFSRVRLSWALAAAQALLWLPWAGRTPWLRCSAFPTQRLPCHGEWGLGPQAAVVTESGLSSCAPQAVVRRFNGCGARA